MSESTRMDPARLLDLLGKLHADVSARASALADRHGARLQCRRGCASCCVDDLTVFEIEAERIRRFVAERGVPLDAGPVGACAFLDDAGACRVYDVRPYVCRTQGLPLRWLEEDPDDAGGWVEYRDICPLNEAGEPLEDLDASELWELGPDEEKLATLAVLWERASAPTGASRPPGPPARVALRSLLPFPGSDGG